MWNQVITPSIGSVNAELFARADLILIPLNPTPADLRALVKGLPLVRESGKPFQFALTRVRPNLRNNDGTAMALNALGLVLNTRMHERVVYAETFAPIGWTNHNAGFNTGMFYSGSLHPSDPVFVLGGLRDYVPSRVRQGIGWQTLNNLPVSWEWGEAEVAVSSTHPAA